MVSRMVLILLYLVANSIIWTLEQPLSSIMFDHFRLCDLQARTKVYRTMAWLGSFGATSPKPIKIMPNNNCIYQLERRMPHNMDKDLEHPVVYQSADGSVTGGPGLKESQEYPWAFACAYFDAINESTPHHLLTISSDTDEPQCNDLWLDAGAKELSDWIGLPFDRVVQ